MTTAADGVPTHRGAVIGGWIARGLMRLLYSVRVDGVEHVPARGPVIFAANHVGFLDAPLLLGVSPRPVHTLAKRDLFRGPLGWLLRGVGQIPLDRESPGRQLLAAGMGVLDAGRVLVVFPEGSRGRGDFAELRNGLTWFASRSGAPVVPVVFVGTTVGDGHTLRSIPRPRARIGVSFGAPIVVPAVGSGTRAALDAATAVLQDALVSHREATVRRFQDIR